MKSRHLREYLVKHEVRFRFDTWACPERNFFYLNTPKAGCTKIKKLLQLLCGFESPPGPSLIHQRVQGQFVKSLLDHTIEEQDYLLNSPEVTRFCFVRSPYSRIVSAYKSKVIGTKKYGMILEHLQHRRLVPSSAAPTFTEFVEFVEQCDDAVRDIHWKSQFRTLHMNQLDYNFIGYFENFQDDLLTVFTKLCASEDLLKTIPLVENSSGIYDYRHFYDPTLQDRVRKIYDIDFKEFDFLNDL